MDGFEHIDVEWHVLYIFLKVNVFILSVIPSGGHEVVILHGSKLWEKRREMKRTHQTDTEEWFNAISHGMTALAAILGFVLLVMLGVSSEKSFSLFSAVVYGLSLVSLYSFSTLSREPLPLGLYCPLWVFRNYIPSRKKWNS